MKLQSLLDAEVRTGHTYSMMRYMNVQLNNEHRLFQTRI